MKNLNQKQRKKTYPKKALLLIATLLIAAMIFSCTSSTIGKYQKEDLPKNFSYTIVDDTSDAALEKNQLVVEISGKLTEGQVATLAETLYNTKDKQRRFYISYKLKGQEDNNSYWAISHFDPDLEIEIMGSTAAQDKQMSKDVKKVDGNVIGVYSEEAYTFSIYTVFEKDGKTFIQNSHKDGSSAVYEMTKIIQKDGNLRLNYQNDESAGEYYILRKNDVLEFYNAENKKFTTAEKTES